VRLDGGDHKARQASLNTSPGLPLSLEKLTHDALGGKILYHTSYNPWLKQNTTLWDAMDFIAALTQFIPPWSVRCIHYYGLCSSRCEARWQRLPYVARVAPALWKESHAEQLPGDPGFAQRRTVPRRACRSAWARLIAKVYEVDPLICPRSEGTMKVIAVIERPAVVRQILDHLGLPSGAGSLRTPPDPPVDVAGDHPREWSYEPFFDDLPVPDPMRG
jgi:hypothetical protein